MKLGDQSNVGRATFYACGMMKEIVAAEGHTKWCKIKNVNYTKLVINLSNSNDKSLCFDIIILEEIMRRQQAVLSCRLRF